MTVLRSHRYRVLAWFLAAAGLILLPQTSIVGQELHVYTKVVDLTATVPGGSPPIVARSLTLFHAGKVYDIVENEMTIYEPALQRFLLIDGRRRIAAEVSLDEIKHSLRHLREKTLEYIGELENSGNPMDLKTVKSFRFQLDPTFEERYTPGSRAFVLQSEYCTYRVQSAAPAEIKDPQVAKAYLEYCDWAKRLNAVLHPQVALPAARLMLNQKLREKGLLPVSVELIADIENRHHLRAEHSFHWELDRIDRDRIAHWERLLDKQELREVTFSEYRQIQHSVTTTQKR